MFLISAQNIDCGYSGFTGANIMFLISAQDIDFG